YTKLHNGSVTKSLLGYHDITIGGEKKKITFDSEVSINNPDVEHITLQHDWTRKILSDIGEFNSQQNVPVVKFKSENETAGYWSLWQISAQNRFETKVLYQPFFISDKGKLFSAYANDIWNRLNSENNTDQIEFMGLTESKDFSDILNEALFVSFQNIEAELKEILKVKKDNKLNSYEFQKSRINKIGIENIRKSRLKRLENEHNKWLSDFEENQKLIPGTKHLLTFRLDGE